MTAARSQQRYPFRIFRENHTQSSCLHELKWQLHVNVESSHLQTCKISKYLYPIHSETVCIRLTGLFSGAQKSQFMLLSLLPPVCSNNKAKLPASLWKKLVCTSSTPTFMVVPQESPQITELSQSTGLHSGVSQTIANKVAVFNKDLSTLHGHIPWLRAEGAGKNTHFPVSPWKGFDYILSQLLPEGLASHQPVSRWWLRSYSKPKRVGGHFPRILSVQLQE